MHLTGSFSSCDLLGLARMLLWDGGIVKTFCEISGDSPQFSITIAGRLRGTLGFSHWEQPSVKLSYYSSATQDNETWDLERCVDKTLAF